MELRQTHHVLRGKICRHTRWRHSCLPRTNGGNGFLDAGVLWTQGSTMVTSFGSVKSFDASTSLRSRVKCA